MTDSTQYQLKWKGRQSGPYSLAQIRSKIKQREISLMHEAFYQGEWITLRALLQRVEPSSSTKERVPAGGIPPAGAARKAQRPVDPGTKRPTQVEKTPVAESAGPGTAATTPLPARSPSGSSPSGSSLSAASSLSATPPPLRENKSLPSAELPQPDIRSKDDSQPAKEEQLPQTLEQSKPEARPSGAHFHAGFWTRCGALSLDLVLIAALLFGLRLLGVLELPPLPDSRTEVTALFKNVVSIHLLGVLALLAFLWLYFAIFESSQLQATPGKRIAGLRVIRSTGGRLSFSGASLRFAVKLASAAPACWGFFLAAFTERKQALHDVLAKCYVVGTLPDSRVIN